MPRNLQTIVEISVFVLREIKVSGDVCVCVCVCVCLCICEFLHSYMRVDCVYECVCMCVRVRVNVSTLSLYDRKFERLSARAQLHHFPPKLRA